MCGCLLHTPNWGSGLQPRHVSWLEIKPVTLWCVGRHAIHWATPARAHLVFFYSIKNIYHNSLNWFDHDRQFEKPSIPVAFLKFLFIYLFFRGRDRGREVWRGEERERDWERKRVVSCCFMHLGIHWLLPVCALTRDWTHNLGMSGWCSNQLSYPARTIPVAF